MRRIARLERSIDLLRPRIIAKTSSPYLCASCKHHATSFSTTTFRPAGRPKETSYSENVRQKMWGTESPPGPKDPYAQGSLLDRTKENEARAEHEEREAKEQKREEAKTAAAPDLTGYEPAATWDGLEEVGGYDYLWDANLDSAHIFTGFMPKDVLADGREITAALHRALVEVFALREAKKPIEWLWKAEPGDDLTMEVQIIQGPEGANLQFPESLSMEALVGALEPAVEEPEVGLPTESEEDVDADRSPIDPLHPTPSKDETLEHENPTESEEDVAADRSEEDPLKRVNLPFGTYDALLASWDPSWLSIPLRDPDVKFAVLKRTMQLTGIRIPDSTIQPTTSVQALLKHLIKPAPPKKLADALLQKEELLSLPNVKISARRITPIDKEKQVGRWKLIEAELRERDLPVTGRG